MVKPNIWRDKIIEILENKSLNYKNLYKEVKSELVKLLQNNNKSMSNRPDKLFNEQLIKLIDDGTLVITGYDKSVHDVTTGKYQSFKKEGVVFELVRTDRLEPMDILILLNQLEDINNSKHDKTRIKLSKIFETKYSMFEKKEINFYRQIYKKVISGPLSEWIEDDDSLSYKKLLNEYPNTKMFKIEGLTNSEAYKILDIKLKVHKERSN